MNSSRGFGLMELMVGMLLALLIALAVMTLYRHSAHVAFDPQTGSASMALQNKQLISTLMTTQQLLQEAGFGVNDAKAGDDLLLPDTGTPTFSSMKISSLSGSTPGRAVFWRFVPDLATPAFVECRGLLLVPESDHTTIYLLSRTDTAASCPALTSVWNNNKFWKGQRLAGAIPAHHQLSFQLSSDLQCTPYGVGSKARYPNLLQKYQQSTSSATPGVRDINREFSTCLINFVPVTP